MHRRFRIGSAVFMMAIFSLGILLISSSSSPAPSTSGKVLTPQVTNTLKYPLIGVDGGTFWMGSDDGDGDEQPRHRVTVDNFFIGEFEVTQMLWEQVMGDNPSEFKGRNLPVENVSWNDCQIFIKNLNQRRGEMNLGEYGSWHFRLPTEAEWEYAARGGNKSRGYKYSGGDDINRVAWYDINSEYHTHNVGSRFPNELGLCYMSGNVFEWCSDWYDYGYYKSSPPFNPQGSSCGYNRVLRGGSWASSATSCRVANRSYSKPYDKSSSNGLRLVLSPNNIEVEKHEETIVYNNNDVDVDVPASFPGGDAALRQFIAKNTVYPEIAIEQGLQGTVVLRFKVDVDGSVSTVSVKKSLSRECDKAAMDVFRKLPKFTPAKKDGHTVPVWFTMPVGFRIW